MLKKIYYPTLLLAIISLLNLIDFLQSLPYLFQYFSFITLVLLVSAFVPVALVAILVLKGLKGYENAQQAIGITCIVGGIAQTLTLCLNMENLSRYFSLDFLYALPSIYTILAYIVFAVMFFIAGINLVRNKEMPPAYTVIFGISIVAMLLLSLYAGVTNPSSLFGGFLDSVYLIALWYLPRIFDENKKYTVEITSKKLIALGVIAALLFGIYAIGKDIASKPDVPKWSELSDVEKENAKWAHDVKEYIDSLE